MGIAIWPTTEVGQGTYCSPGSAKLNSVGDYKEELKRLLCKTSAQGSRLARVTDRDSGKVGAPWPELADRQSEVKRAGCEQGYLCDQGEGLEQ
jgi:hypothetical protein